MQNKDTLDELNKGCTMALDSLNNVLEKAENKSFKNLLRKQYNEYESIHKKIELLYSKYSDEEPTEIGAMAKAFAWSSVEMKTLMDDSDSKIAELLLQGTNMGIIEGRRLINHKPNVDPEVDKILHEFVDFQEEFVELLKKYL